MSFRVSRVTQAPAQSEHAKDSPQRQLVHRRQALGQPQHNPGHDRQEADIVRYASADDQEPDD